LLPATGNYTKVELPTGVSVELPDSWTVLSNNQMTAISQINRNQMGVYDATSELKFGANLVTIQVV
jgi:hypothetical protein